MQVNDLTTLRTDPLACPGRRKRVVTDAGDTHVIHDRSAIFANIGDSESADLPELLAARAEVKPAAV